MLAPDLVLTAAHCFKDLRPKSNNQPPQPIYIANHPQCRHQNNPNRDRLPVDRIFIHPQYDTVSFNADIALVTLLKRYYEATVEIDFDPAQVEVLTKMQVVGYGYTRVEEKENRLYTVYPLQEAHVRVASEFTCLELMGAKEECKKFLNYTSMLCGLGLGVNTGDGDSGGPVMIRQNDGSWKQVGIVSWGPASECLNSISVDVFVRLSTFKEWITQTFDLYAHPLLQPNIITIPPDISGRCIEAEALECDVEALLSFKNALTRGQELFESWSGNDPCSWEYVTCSTINFPNQRVTEIDLDWGSVNLYRMTGILSAQWSQLRYLTSLKIATQNISGSLVAEYSVLDKMEVFWVYKTDISSTLPKEYSVWTSLTNFATSFNNLIGSVPEEYSLWELVEKFYIGQNQKLGGTIPVQFSTWTKMYDFHISSCQFSGSLPATFSLWENCCDRFYVFNNQLTGTLPPQYSTMLKMNEFLVRSNMITGSLPRQFSTFRGCVNFFAFQNQLTGTLPSQYSTMTKMERMSVSRNNLSGSLPKEYSSMMSLQLFQSFNNKISSIIPLEWSVIDSADIDV